MRGCTFFVFGVCGLGFAVAGCGKVKGESDAAVDAVPTFNVSGTVTGFAGSGLVLRLNGTSDVTVSANGAFSFPDALGNGASYTVTVATEPTCPHRVCTLAN